MICRYYACMETWIILVAGVVDGKFRKTPAYLAILITFLVWTSVGGRTTLAALQDSYQHKAKQLT